MRQKFIGTTAVGRKFGVATATILKWLKTGRITPDYVEENGFRRFDSERIKQLVIERNANKSNKVSKLYDGRADKMRETQAAYRAKRRCLGHMTVDVPANPFPILTGFIAEIIALTKQ